MSPITHTYKPETLGPIVAKGMCFYAPFVKFIEQELRNELSVTPVRKQNFFDKLLDRQIPLIEIDENNIEKSFLELLKKYMHGIYNDYYQLVGKRNFFVLRYRECELKQEYITIDSGKIHLIEEFIDFYSDRPKLTTPQIIELAQRRVNNPHVKDDIYSLKRNLNRPFLDELVTLIKFCKQTKDTIYLPFHYWNYIKEED